MNCLLEWVLESFSLFGQLFCQSHVSRWKQIEKTFLSKRKLLLLLMMITLNVSLLLILTSYFLSFKKKILVAFYLTHVISVIVKKQQVLKKISSHWDSNSCLLLSQETWISFLAALSIKLQKYLIWYHRILSNICDLIYGSEPKWSGKATSACKPSN